MKAHLLSISISVIALSVVDPRGVLLHTAVQQYSVVCTAVPS